MFGVFGVAVAQQDDNHGHQVHHDDGTIISSNGSDKSYILGLGSSDMEIGDCLATYSFLFGIWQNVKVNPLCEADKMDAQGNHRGAAEMRCSTHKYKKVYGKDCIDAVIYIPNNPEPQLSDEQTEYVAKEEYEDRIAALEELFDKQETDNQRQQRVQQQQYQKIQHAEDVRQKKIDLIREEFGEQTTTASD